MLGDPTKAREELGWDPKLKFDGLVEMMVDADVAAQKRELYLRDGGLVGAFHAPARIRVVPEDGVRGTIPSPCILGMR